MAKKGGMPIYESVDDYISNQPDRAQPLLTELRNLIQEAAPEMIEIPNSKVPSFTLVSEYLPKLQLMIAAYSKYVSFYPFETTLAHFLDELKDYDLGKGTVKFKYDDVIPQDLVQRMVKYRIEEIINHSS